MIEFYIIRTVEALLIPPGLNFAMMLLGLLLMRWFYRGGKLLILTGLVTLFLFSLPIVSQGLFSLLESYPALSKAQLQRPSAEAIVILGGGLERAAREYHGQDSVSPSTLERVRYGAYLHRQTRLPILVSGGKVFPGPYAEAEVMQQALRDDFHIGTRWLDKQSRNTWQNAVNSQQILSQQKIKRIYLVTHALHMPRAVMAFRQTGLEVIPAPMGFRSINTSIRFTSFLPNGDALHNLRLWSHETLGYLWYKLRY